MKAMFERVKDKVAIAMTMANLVIDAKKVEREHDIPYDMTIKVISDLTDQTFDFAKFMREQPDDAQQWLGTNIFMTLEQFGRPRNLADFVEMLEYSIEAAVKLSEEGCEEAGLKPPSAEVEKSLGLIADRFKFFADKLRRIDKHIVPLAEKLILRKEFLDEFYADAFPYCGKVPSTCPVFDPDRLAKQDKERGYEPS